jgi:hypothetical protein
MATIVTQQQQQAPFGAQLLETLLTDLLVGGIQRSRDAARTKRESAFLTDLAGQRQPGGWEPDLTGYFDTNPLNPMNPDAVPAPQMVQTPGTTPGLSDVAMSLKNHPRVAPDRAFALANPLIQGWQQEDERAKRDAYAAELAGMSQNDPSMWTRLLSGNALGYTDSAALGHAQNMHEHMNPHKTFSTVNTGDTVTGYAFDPGTGNAVEAFRRAVGLSPDTRATVGARYAEIARSNRPKYAPNLVQDENGQYHTLETNSGTLAPTGIKGAPKTSSGGRDYSVLTPAERLRSLVDYYKVLQDSNATNTPEGERILAQINALYSQILGLGGDTSGGGVPGAAAQGKVINQEQYQFLRNQGITDEQMAFYGYTVQ